MTLSRFAFAIASFSLLLVSLHAAAEDDKPEAAAQKNAESWLALVDTGKYADSYDAAAEAFKAQVTKEKWISMVGSARTGTGSFESRKMVTAEYTETIPGAPAGKYVVIRYDAKFASGSAAEQIVSMQEKDGTWRVVGYVVSPVK